MEPVLYQYTILFKMCQLFNIFYTRYENIEVEYYDMNWKKQRQKLSGWLAQICQHELDHLEGILI